MFFSPGPIRNLLEEAKALLGELDSKLLLHFSYKMALGVEGKGFNTLGKHISLKISEEKKKEGENQGRGTFVTLL